MRFIILKVSISFVVYYLNDILLTSEVLQLPGTNSTAYDCYEILFEVNEMKMG